MNPSMPATIIDDDSQYMDMDVIQSQPILNPVGFDTPSELIKIFDMEAEMEERSPWSLSPQGIGNACNDDDWAMQPSSMSIGDESNSTITSDEELLEWIPDFSEDDNLGEEEDSLPMIDELLLSSDQGVHQRKLLEFMKRTSETRASLAIVTPTTEAYNRRTSLTRVISSVRDSSSRVAKSFQA